MVDNINFKRFYNYMLLHKLRNLMFRLSTNINIYLFSTVIGCFAAEPPHEDLPTHDQSPLKNFNKLTSQCSAKPIKLQKKTTPEDSPTVEKLTILKKSGDKILSEKSSKLVALRADSPSTSVEVSPDKPVLSRTTKSCDAPAQPHNVKRLNIALADDNEFMRFILKSQLKAHIVTEKVNGAELLKTVRDADFDIVFSDGQMPVMDGPEVIKQLRDMGNKVPFIIITGDTSDSFRELCLKNGANEVLHKPVPKSELLKMLTTYIPSFGKKDGA